MGWIEGAGGRREVENLEPASAIVVLSGMLQDRKDAPLGEWSDAVDRFEGGVELFQAGKAPLLIFTGGHVPWRPEDRPEGEILKKRAVKLGVPENKIQVTGKAGNTADEAGAVMDLFRKADLGIGIFKNQGSEHEKVKKEIRKAESSSSRAAGGALLVTNNSPPKSRTPNPEPSTEARPGSPGARHRIILVTSAFHMPRARMLFERQGFEVEPFPV
ncbi:MAG: YdcF family protein, partial [Sphingomonadales bacterium]|nr:YdcF family protein [Sphingomonadales bacterium]